MRFSLVHLTLIQRKPLVANILEQKPFCMYRKDSSVSVHVRTCLHACYMCLSTYSLHVLVYVHARYMYCLHTCYMCALVYMFTTCTCLHSQYIYVLLYIRTHYMYLTTYTLHMYLSTYSLHVLVCILATCTYLHTYLLHEHSGLKGRRAKPELTIKLKCL